MDSKWMKIIWLGISIISAVGWFVTIPLLVLLPIEMNNIVKMLAFAVCGGLGFVTSIQIWDQFDELKRMR